MITVTQAKQIIDEQILPLPVKVMPLAMAA
jgi:hypothetical protein